MSKKTTAKNKSEKPYRSELVELETAKIVKADWNYKEDGTPEQISKLRESINKDRSAGVIPVRELDDGTFEAIDGNHRFDAIMLEPAWETVYVENFGKISLAEAITIANRRNYQWFEDDVLKLSTLFKESVLPEFKIEDLATFMPQSEEELKELLKLTEFNWDALPAKQKADKEKGDKLQIEMTEKLLRVWNEWTVHAKEEYNCNTAEEAFFYAVRMALAESKGVPVELDEPEEGVADADALDGKTEAVAG